MPPLATPFVRDRLTWLTYLINAWGTYSVAAISPLMAFLAVDLSLNYTQRGLHTSTFAIGTMLAGVLTDRAAARFSRHRVLWAGGAGLAGGLLAVVLAQSPIVSLAGVFMVGLLGTAMFVMGQAALADDQGENRSIAFSESSVGASIAGLFAPLLISLSETLLVGWRVAVLLSPFLWASLFLWGRKVAIPSEARAQLPQAGRKRLSRLYWVFWAMMFLGMATEWSVSFWTPEFLTQVVGVEATAATAALSLFWLAFIFGRIAGSLLARRFQPMTLLLSAAAIVACSFPVLWLARDATVAFSALFLLSFGLANFFPLILALATSAGANNINAATARIALAGGAAILIAPQLLGSLGDLIGIGAAFSLVGVLAVTTLALGLFARRVQNRRGWRVAEGILT